MRAEPLVLLVDDENEFLEIASLKLRGKGFETAMANGGYEGIEKAERFQPDLVLTDVYMPPGPSGWDVALELHRNPQTRNIKLVFFTSLRDPWAELPVEVRTTVAAELGKPVILSKTEDVEKLGDRIGFLLA